MNKIGKNINNKRYGSFSVYGTVWKQLRRLYGLTNLYQKFPQYQDVTENKSHIIGSN